MNIENENLLIAAARDSINLFLGAGFSVRAKSRVTHANGSQSDVKLPVGNELGTELVKLFELDHLSSLPLPKLATVIRKTKRERLEGYLKSRFTVVDFDSRYKKLFDFKVSSVFTTNIDDLIAKILAGSPSHYLHDITVRGPNLADRSAVKYFPLHGSVTHAEADYKFTTEELVTAFGQDPDRFHYLSKELQETPTLFWGYSLEDAGVIEALSDTITQGRGTAPRWIAIRKADVATEEYFKAQGFSIIVADTDELLDYFSRLDLPERNQSALGSTKLLFPDHFVPSVNEVKVRPITEFLSGDEPEWYDIFSGALFRTHHFDRLRNVISSGRHTLFLGIPGAGKSTLLKQLAGDQKSGLHKLFLRLPSIDQVRTIAARLAKENSGAIVFIDDFADDIESIVELMGTPRVQVVACTREFSFDLISNRLDLSKASVFNVSELTDFDIQAIFDRIPTSIRSDTLGRHRDANDEDSAVSFFELIEANVRTPTLRKRMYDALTEIKGVDDKLYEILVATAYVHHCGTPMTTDMLHAFLRPHNVNVVEVPALIDQLGSLLQEYTGGNAEISQDNFRLRSKLMADAVFQNVPNADFRRAFEQFHEEVSPYRISRFDVFRRRAFDERYATKAFPNWEDGLAFFENAHKKDGSPELLQQGALYLSHRKQMKLAFQWIDKARLAKPRSFSIRNSHAVILFRANIDLASSDSSVNILLKQSMDILAECYKSDRRKSYHAIVFAGQALDLASAIGRSEAEQYLIEAKNWIATEKRRQSWEDPRLNRLERKLSRQM